MASPLSAPTPSRASSNRTPQDTAASDDTQESGSTNTRFTPPSDSDDASERDPFSGNDVRDVEKSIPLRPIPSRRSYEESHDGSKDAPRPTSGGKYLLYSPQEERGVIWKFDRRVVLFMALLYMLSFLDRSSKSQLQSDALLTDS